MANIFRIHKMQSSSSKSVEKSCGKAWSYFCNNTDKPCCPGCKCVDSLFKPEAGG